MKIINRRLSLYGWVGVGLMSAAWFLNSVLSDLRTHFLFFPLWLGFILTIDALVFRRKGTSLIHRSRRDFVFLFLLSAPAWWVFELINLRTQNWIYLGRDQFSALSYFFWATLNFSTVIPAVFESAELAETLPGLRRLRFGPSFRPDRRMEMVGWGMLVLLLLVPVLFYPFVWLAPLFILEPLNRRLRFSSLWDQWEKGEWRWTAALAAGALLCGFFWEMWNLHSFPKWIYHVPIFGFCKVFEMPLLGYLGYPPFALSLYSFYCLIRGLFRRFGINR